MAELSKRIPPGAGCVLVVRMGNDYWDWHNPSSKAEAVEKFHEMVEVLAARATDVRLQLFGSNAFWKYGAAFDTFVKEMTAVIRTKEYPKHVQIEYADELEKMQLTLKSSHTASTDAERFCELVAAWLEHPRHGWAEAPALAAAGVSLVAPCPETRPADDAGKEDSQEALRAGPGGG